MKKEVVALYVGDLKPTNISSAGMFKYDEESKLFKDNKIEEAKYSYRDVLKDTDFILFEDTPTKDGEGYLEPLDKLAFVLAYGLLKEDKERKLNSKEVVEGRFQSPLAKAKKLVERPDSVSFNYYREAVKGFISSFSDEEQAKGTVASIANIVKGVRFQERQLTFDDITSKFGDTDDNNSSFFKFTLRTILGSPVVLYLYCSPLHEVWTLKVCKQGEMHTFTRGYAYKEDHSEKLIKWASETLK